MGCCITDHDGEQSQPLMQQNPNPPSNQNVEPLAPQPVGPQPADPQPADPSPANAQLYDPPVQESHDEDGDSNADVLPLDAEEDMKDALESSNLPEFVHVRTSDDEVVAVPKTTAIQIAVLKNVDSYAANHFIEVESALYEVFSTHIFYLETPAMIYDYNQQCPRDFCAIIGAFAQELAFLEKIKSDVLGHVITFCEYHHVHPMEEIAKPIRSIKMERIVNDVWFANYINRHSKKTIFQIIVGANYLDVQPLLHLGCAKIATLIKGKSPDEIRAILAEGDDDDDNDDQGDNDADDARVSVEDLMGIH